MANLKDIAQKLGVSVSTVSRGLNGGKEISREMTEKILKAADELGYTLQGRGGRGLFNARVIGQVQIAIGG